MRKIIMFLLGIFSIAIVFFTKINNDKISGLEFKSLLSNNSANAEITVGPLCQLCPCDFCFIEPDGWYARGILY